MLYIFDLDKTLVYKQMEVELIPSAREWLRRYRPSQVAIATNQGGVGLRYWMEPRDDYGGFGDEAKWMALPTEELARTQLVLVVKEVMELTGGSVRPYISYRYYSKDGNWSPVPAGREDDPYWSKAWRKPAPGMLLQACEDYEVSVDDAIFVGDDQDGADSGAAKAAGMAFCKARAFFMSPVEVLDGR